MKAVARRLSVLSPVLVVSLALFLSACAERGEDGRAAAAPAGAASAGAVPAVAPAGGVASEGRPPREGPPPGSASPRAAGLPPPVPAGLEEILRREPASWRRPEWELYAWNRIPSVLIFDFRDYEVQARFFRRLGFFVAVKGESGRVEEESYYAGRHVYNAHDYRPEDLVRFFRRAVESGVRLNEEERLLGLIGLAGGVLRAAPAEPGGLLPGAGAILSISRESPAALRRRLLAHETAHGVFYAVPAFRDGCFRLWESLPEGERELWRLFLANKGRLDGRAGYDGYDTGNLYLTVNEMQAHLLQLERGEVRGYFVEGYLPRLEKLLPERRAELARLREEHAAGFEDTRLRLEDLLERALGVPRGDLYASGAAGPRAGGTGSGP
jgi:hypothetical protein